MRMTAKISLRLVLLAVLTGTLCLGASSCLSEIVPWNACVEAATASPGAQRPLKAGATPGGALDEPGHRF